MSLQKPRISRQLQMMAQLGISLRFELVDHEGRSRATGKSRVQDYQELAHELVVDVPTQDGRLLEVADGDSARLTFELDEIYYRMETEVLGRLHYVVNGYRLAALRLRGPARLESGSHRRFFRVEPLPQSKPIVRCRLVPEVGEVPSEWVNGILADLSGRSLGILLPSQVVAQIRLGQRIEVSLVRRDGPKAIQVLCWIRRIDEVAAGKQHKEMHPIGLEIDLPSDHPNATHQELARFAAECEREFVRYRRRIA